MKAPVFASIVLACLTLSAQAAERYPDRFVWVFGWGLDTENNTKEICRVIDTAGHHGINGAVCSLGLDSLSKQSPEYFRRLDEVKRVCDTNHMELIPAVFSIGYGGTFLSHNPNLAEGLEVENAPFVVKGNEAQLEPDHYTQVLNGGFEEFNGNNLKSFSFHDDPGKVSFADHDVKHSGNASLRLENFTANPYGHGRVMQTIKVHPHRCYRMTIWVKTENLKPANAFRAMALAGDRDLAPREFGIPSTTDWRRISMLFNSSTNDKVNIYAGLWDAKSGKVWLDDWSVEEVGPVNVLHRHGTPVTVRRFDGGVTYTEGKDYAPPGVGELHPWHDDGNAAPLKILPGSRIHEGEHLAVSWYHSMLIHDSQVTVCMAEPEVYQIIDQETKLLADRLHPKRILLNMDEVRMGGTCRACRGRDMGELLGECVTKQTEIIHRYLPDAKVYVWADMFDPGHNAHGKYYLVDGDYTGSWKHVPKEVVMAVWSGEPREKSIRFFAEQGFQSLAACYYDADNLDQVEAWLQVAGPIPHVRGFMYTPWERKYSLLPAFGDLLMGQH